MASQTSDVKSSYKLNKNSTLPFNLWSLTATGRTSCHVILTATGIRSGAGLGVSRRSYSVTYDTNTNTMAVATMVDTFAHVDLVPFALSSGATSVCNITSGSASGTFTGTVNMDIYIGSGQSNPSWTVSVL